MQTLITFVEGIGHAILGFFTFLWTLVEDIVYLVQLAARMLAQIPGYFTWLPAPVVSLIILAITIAVIYKIIGRD